VAPTSTTVLLEAETGCGKGEAAESLHRASTRRHGPFVIVDCGAVPAPLLESELFGHEKGAFTGAHTRRVGAFEAANGGTIFLDEIGELPSELQPKLLRVLENRHVRRLGSNAYAPIDVRVIGATNRDLRADVNASRFRPDLYFRLAVVKIALPPLRARPEDIPALAEHILGALGASAEQVATILTPAFVQDLQGAPWRGNVRELRNHLERALIFPEATVVGAESPTSAHAGNLSYAAAKERALSAFEREYVETLLRAHGRRVSAAAEASGLSREYLYRLMRRHGIGA
jgi:DNA-binding NtrC family response regulator